MSTDWDWLVNLLAGRIIDKKYDENGDWCLLNVVTSPRSFFSSRDSHLRIPQPDLLPIAALWLSLANVLHLTLELPTPYYMAWHSVKLNRNFLWTFEIISQEVSWAPIAYSSSKAYGLGLLEYVTAGFLCELRNFVDLCMYLLLGVHHSLLISIILIAKAMVLLCGQDNQ